MSDKAAVKEVKRVLSVIINAGEVDPYAASVMTFEAVYGRKYTGADRAELERIKWHAKRMLAGESGEWGGVRQGAGYRKQAQEVSE